MLIFLGNDQESLDSFDKKGGICHKGSNVEENPELGEPNLIGPAELPINSCLIEGLPHLYLVYGIGGSIVEPC